MIITGKKIWDVMSRFTDSNKFFLGLTMVLFNLGSKYIVMDLSKSHEAFLKSTFIRRTTLFCMFFVATRDLYTSLVMTSVFIILALGFFNENSTVSLIPKSLLQDVHITQEELQSAKEVINTFEMQQQTAKKLK